jgi:hypothetical protein
MEKFNCEKLNQFFNIYGVNYILIEDIKNQSNSISTTNLNKKRLIKDFVRKREEILKITKSNSDDVIYQKKKDNAIDDINEWIDKTLDELLEQQYNLLTHLDWKNSYTKKTEKLPLSEYKKVRESFIKFIQSLDNDLNVHLYNSKCIVERKKHNEINFERRKERLKEQVNRQKECLKKNNNLQNFSGFTI